MRFFPTVLRSSLIAAAAVAVIVAAAVAPGQATAQEEAPAPPPAATASGDPVVAIVDGRAIRRSDVLAAAEDLPERDRELPIEMVYPRIVDRMIDVRLIAAEGRKANLDGDREVVRRIEEAKDRIVQEVFLTRYVEETMTDAMLRERYDSFVRNNPPAPQAKVRHILVGTEERAKDLLDDLDDGADFAELASEWSIGPEASIGGYLGWVGGGDMPVPFVREMLALGKGGVSKLPVETDFGFHVLSVEDVRTVPAPSFREMRGRLVIEVSNKLIAELIGKLRTEADIQKFRFTPTQSASE